MVTPHELRKLGWRVRITHFRNLNQKACKKWQMSLIPLFKIKGQEILSSLSKGGKVIAELTPPSSTIIFAGTCICSPLETFNRREVMQSAFQKALVTAGIVKNEE